ncbi:MAG: purine-nucleoside phosphorylase [Lachnospiraceae bacterium]
MVGEVYDKLKRCLECVQRQVNFQPEIALVLGSGLGDYAREIDVVKVLPYQEIEDFPQSTVEGHAGQFVFGYIQGIPVVIMQGRVHYYEGYSMTDVVLPIRLMALMGAKILLLTNAAGGLNSSFRAGDFMLITDQIAAFVPNPLMGANENQLGVRFPDMSEIYDEDLQQIIREAASQIGILLKEGVYIQLTGPSYESKAEVRMCQMLGADAVGMSTACEAIAANHMGMKICGISFISNPAAGLQKAPLSHEEVKRAADSAAPIFKQLITQSVVKMEKIIRNEQ